MDYSNMTMTQVAKLPGVSDIQPLLARGKFAQALIAEANGDKAKAEGLLQEAIEKLA